MAVKNKKVRGVPAVDQPREKLIKSGIKSLSTRDLVALILRSGLKGKNVLRLADEILKKFTLVELSRVTIDELISIYGVGISRAASLVAAFELNRRLADERKNLKPVLDTPEKVYCYVGDLHNATREKFIALLLDVRIKVISRCHISMGTVSSSIVHPRDVFKPAIEKNASQIIVVHNHPSGEESPSEEDLELTDKLKKAGEIIGIPLMDHIIVTGKGYYSFKENKKL